VGRVSARERYFSWALIGLSAIVGVVAFRDSLHTVGRVVPGFALMENAQLGAGGAPRRGLEPLDVVCAVNDKPVTLASQVYAEIERHPPGTPIAYTLSREGRRVTTVIPSKVVTRRDFGHIVIDNTVSGFLVLALGALVLLLRPGTPESRLFLAFCLVTGTVNLIYFDMMLVHRFTRLLLAVWPFTPALVLHLALTFPERRRLVDRWPWLVWTAYAVSAVLVVWIQWNFLLRVSPVGEITAAYAGLAALALIGSLAWTMGKSPTRLARRRARVLLLGFGIGYVLPLLATSIELVFGVTVPYLTLVWKLNVVFPAAVAYAIVRYRLFDVGTVLRTGAVYSLVTGLVALGYVAVLTVSNLLLARLGMSASPVLLSAVAALAVVLLMNPVYGSVRTLVDRLFFRARYDAQRSLDSLADQMTTVLELDRLEALITRTAAEIWNPRDVALLLPSDGARGFRGLSATGRAVQVSDDGALARTMADLRGPVTRPRLLDDPDLAGARDACLRELDPAGAEAMTPVLFRGRVTALLALGRRRGDADYSDEDLRVLRVLANQSAVALENARAYRALEAALRRVQVLESIRANLAKFVPRTVRDLVEREPEAPALAKRDVDVSVLFIDIVGYSRLSERLDAARLNELVERYFGAFLDEILEQGGDVNETAGDGLMVIFQDGDRRRHAVSSVLAGLGVLRRTGEINAASDQLGEAISVHVGVNSGLAAVGATRIEGTAGTRWTYTASGPVTNVAARLAALGDGDAVMMGEETRRRLGLEWSAEDLGERALKNIEEPVRVFRMRETSSASVALEPRM
jgi:class 3 adenylate cyclase